MTTPLVVLVALWTGLGLFGHDPWKPDEAYTFGLVFHILQTGDWLVPTLGGEPFMEKPPVFFATAAAFAGLFGWALPLHDAARLASGFYVALTLAFTGLTARALYGQGKGWPAALFLVACLGYVHHAHLLLTDNALMAGMAMALYGLALRKPLAGGILLGTGTGIAFMSKGLLGPGLMGLTVLALLCFREWRTKEFLKAWPWALLAFAPWALLWPWLLAKQSPELFHEWLWVQNLGRFTGEHKIGGVPDHLHYVKALPWFAFPAWLLAVFARKNTVLPATAFAVMFVVLSASSLARQVYALPMLIPICVLAAGGLASTPAWLAKPLDKLAVWGAGLLGLALWVAWLVFPERLAAAYPGFQHQVQPALLVAALVVTGAWLWFVRIPDLAVRWAAGSTLVWGLAMTLWLPYVDYAKTYRHVIADMQKHRPAVGGCVASRALSEPQRAVFHYFAGIQSIREQLPAARDCPLLLVHTSDDRQPPAEGRKLVWRGHRPGDDKERLWLFSR